METSIQQTSAPIITLALPAYNERDNIVGVLTASIRALEALALAWEIVVIDNHSSDDTASVVEAFARTEPRVRLIRHDCNRLYSGSCRTALTESRGTYVAIMDSDGQFTAADLPCMMAKLRSGANLVFGWRKTRHDPLSRKLISWVFNRLGKWRLGFPLHDLNVGIRMFDRRFLAAASIKHPMNMANPELYVWARQAGLRVEEVEVQHFERTKGKTSHNFLRLIGIFRDVNRYFRTLQRELNESRAPSTNSQTCSAAGCDSSRKKAA